MALNLERASLNQVYKDKDNLDMAKENSLKTGNKTGNKYPS